MNKLSDIISGAIGSIPPLDEKAMAAAQQRQNSLTKPHGSLGRLEELSIRMAGITGQTMPVISHKAIITMAADHGVTAEGVSLYPSEVTPQMVLNFLSGGAAINVLTRHVNARVIIVDMGVKGGFPPTPGLLNKSLGNGTANMARMPAMSRQQAIAALETGIGIVGDEAARGLDIVGTGDMGIGNTTASSAVFAAFSGYPVKKITGRGTGVAGKQLALKVSVIERALAQNRPDPADAVDVLAKVGGFEIGGLAGVILGAAARRLPVVIDGFISGAASLVATSLAPRVRDYLFAAHLSAEAGHKLMLQYLGLKPLLTLDMRLGEGTGAALGMTLIESACKILCQMSTFGEAGVSEAE